MVYLRRIISENRLKITQFKNIELVAYLSIVSPEELGNYDFELSPDEEVALKGYRRETVDSQSVAAILSKTPIKGISATSNIYKFSGLYLLSMQELAALYKTKFEESSLIQKYFISKVDSSFTSLLYIEINKITEDNASSIVIKQILSIGEFSEDNIDRALLELTKSEIDIQTQILLEDLEKSLLKIKYIGLNPEELVRNILSNFSNSIRKIIKNRRKGHADFSINDEYDVQDILYVVLKSVFPHLRDEDAIAKVGAKSTKIDLILREEQILIEAKMIKQSDTNETHFIEELKVDFESYHQCNWLSKLFCFVYDPYEKTKDLSNFHDLNGTRVKNGHKFSVEVIVVN
ncbi:hypothetical protein ACOMSG_03100 [Macellibacteroides fermentans]|uniref:PD-(D/E)XK nuclease domain-containing protein n=1 Tax=Macellibacteroides fermentans TaxID=879969 RepID=UPI003B922DB1